MPARSNAYQKVLYYVQRNLAPDARVTESAMVADSRTGELREVDVLIEGTMAGHRVAIGMEVRDRALRATIQWIDEMRGKFDDLPIDKVVLISRSGFTKGAHDKARALGIETLTPSQDVSDNGPLAALEVQAWMANVSWKLVSEAIVWIAGSSDPYAATAKTALFTPDGTEVSTVAEWSSGALMQSPDFLAGADDGRLEIKVTHESPGLRNEEAGEVISMMVRTEPDRSLHRIDKMDIVWNVELTREPMELEGGFLYGTPFGFGKFSDPQGEAIVIVTPGSAPDNSPRPGPDEAGLRVTKADSA